ncbi:putative tuberous sclerosis 2 isoform 3-like protein [Daphnia pulex]|uniref:Putative tuberous sclerosis 2 isoform 3-like protein n=1 Tax=Daphnia pulex TaxID=6669 RepID=E9HI87_DAPPU|nr:putative tuberous sclerosis 2 isoform 3-like protein [Daphnia pulex]|eukprot:EFX68537.1 putative tuberous sclerosis 2 isoform 3-like protein [Daphnia pulex]
MSNNRDKTFPEKLKQFFKFSSKSPASSQSQTCGSFPRLKVEKFVLTRDVQRSLTCEIPVGQRLKTLQEIGEEVASKRIEDDGAETLWLLINDLFVISSTEERQTALMFLKNLITGQYERLGMLRVYIFDIVKESQFNEDNFILIELLKAMTDNGKDLLYLEESIGGFLLQFLLQVSQLQLLKQLLPFLLNVIKFNSAYVDGNMIGGVVSTLCGLAISSSDPEEILLIISVFDAIICYSNLPNESIVVFTSTLCRLVNVSSYSNLSWKIMRNLIGTHLGTSTLYTLIHSLQTSEDPSLLRGGIFFIGMVLWSDRPANCPICPPAVVLPALSEALKHSKNPLVIFETGLTMQKLVRLDGANLVGLAWDWILEILDHFLQFGEEYPKVRQVFLELLSDVQDLVERGVYMGSVELFFATMERGLPYLNESSVVLLMNFQLEKIKPSQPNWISNLNKYIQRFYVEEKRIQPRFRILDMIESTVVTQRRLHDEELLELVLLPLFQNLHLEHDVSVREKAVDLIVSLCHHCNSKHCTGLLDVLERIMERPFNVDHGDIVNIPSEEELGDVVKCTNGLIELFLVKMYQLPSSHAVQIYKTLVRHANLHYEKPIYFEFALSTKLAVFDFILNITADGDYRLGYAPLPRYSPYILIDHKHGERVGGTNRKEIRSATEDPTSTVHSQVTQMSLGEACVAVIRCLNQERDWRVLKLVLERIPRVLNNKALVLSRHNTDIDYVGRALCSLISDTTLNNPETLRNAPPKFSRAEFQLYVFRVLTSLASYHAYLKPETQQKLVKCLEVGLKFKDTAKTCVVALTISALEMKETMYKLLPGVLLSLSKISATVSIAPNILEFLSTLNRLPEVYSSFVEEQYLSIFAITLPFINPFKFNHYVVSLAHHVVSLWFLSCKLPLRKNFVCYIVKGFKNNVLIPCEEGLSQMAQNQSASGQSSAEELSSRVRSGSFSRTGNVRSTGAGDATKVTQDETRIMFHRELMETCADLMSRYTYGNSAPYAQQSDTVGKILKDGPSQTWLIGHKLVTITTSPCLRVANQRGLCDRCSLLCKLGSGETSVPATETDDPPSPVVSDVIGFRRRHRSAMSPAALSPGEHGIDSRTEDIQAKLRSRHKSSIDDRRLTIDMDDPNREQQDPESKASIAQIPCVCYCSGWAKIHIRRPTGDTSWVTRLLNPPQSINDVFLLSDWSEEPVPNLATVLIPKLDTLKEASNFHPKLDRSVSASAALRSPSNRDEIEVGDGISIEEDSRERPPIARQTSLKEIPSSSRKSCEAIPEESKEVEGVKTDDITDFHPHPRDRVYTMPALNMQRRGTNDPNLRRNVPNIDSSLKDANASSGSNPSFIFLQLYYSPMTSAVTAANKEGSEAGLPPILVPNNIHTAIKNLDRIPPYETHKIGVLYVGKGQAGKESEILANEHGSVRYMEFLHKLGQLISLNEVDTRGTYIGGLEVSGADGKFAYLWKDDVLQVIFHVATLMPTLPKDPAGTNKKRHIGNNYVTIVYNDSGEDHQMNTIRGQFNHACVIVEPLDHATHRVTLKCRDDLHELMGGPVEPKLVSDRNVSLLSRQMAFHSNLAALILQSKSNYPYASNWLERLRQIKRTKARLEKEDVKEREKNPWLQYNLSSTLDFTEFTSPKTA